MTGTFVPSPSPNREISLVERRVTGVFLDFPLHSSIATQTRVDPTTREVDTMSLNRTELVAKIAERANLTKTDADAALSALQEVLVDSLAKGEAVKITGLMSVERSERAARKGRNPRTGEEIEIPAGYGVKLTAGSTLKKAVAK